MKYGLVENIRTEAQPKLRGVCPFCGSEVIAKCGKVLAWHWAHKGNRNCDPWWENETDWHRQWKNQFPKEWQEVIHYDDATGEKHVADVKTPHGLVIEFQHSVIKPEEIEAREKFYKNMIWIVDGKRSELDEANFRLALCQEIESNPIAFGIRWWSRSRLLHNWAGTISKVMLDFGENHVWRLIFFDQIKKTGAVGPMDRLALIEDCISGAKQFRLYFRDDKIDQDT